MTLVNSEYKIGDVVYFKTDEDQKKNIVVGVLFRESSVEYEIAQGSFKSWHFGFELSSTENVLTKIK